MTTIKSKGKICHEQRKPGLMERVFSLFWIRRHSLVGEASDAFSLTIRRSSNKTSNHHQGISTAHNAAHVGLYICSHAAPKQICLCQDGPKISYILESQINRLSGRPQQAASLMDIEKAKSFFHSYEFLHGKVTFGVVVWKRVISARQLRYHISKYYTTTNLFVRV